MQRIVLKSLELRNFKGIRDLSVQFDNDITVIYAENGVGKTSIFDAFNWLLFDKDSQDRVVGDKESNFQIKTYDDNGDIIHFLEHEVKGVLDVGGKELTLSKSYKEKWTKKRGQAEQELTGHETTYYVNDVPVRMSDYRDRIKEVIDENVFKLITNPMYFSVKLNQKDRRDALMAVLGEIDDEQVINYNEKLEGLKKALGGDKTIEEFKAMIAAKKKKLNADIANIPPRIDECYKAIQDVDFDSLDTRKKEIASSINDLKEQLADTGKADEAGNNERTEINKSIYALQTELAKLDFEWRYALDSATRFSNNNRRELEATLRQFKNEVDRDIRNRDENTKERKQNIDHVADLKVMWKETNELFLKTNEDDFLCPTCNREYDEDKVDEMRVKMQENFDKNKVKKLADITQNGKQCSARVRELDDYIGQSNENITKLEAEIVSINEQLQAKDGVPLQVEDKTKERRTEIEVEIQELQAKLNAIPINNSSDEAKKDIMTKLGNLESELRNVAQQSAYKEINKERTTRIEELKAEEKKLAQQIADLQRQEIMTEEFTRTKVELLEGGINAKFKHVSFKLFNVQVNGAITDTCEALINGVPFSNANSAAQINAGIDIINTLSDFYQVQAPIFVDKSESINHIIDTGSQLIRLEVSMDRTFRIEHLKTKLEEI